MNDMSFKADPSPLFSVELEQQLLGAVMMNNARFNDLGGSVRPEHFAEPVHGLIWRKMAGRIVADHIASPVALKTDFEGDPALKNLGGSEYIIRMAGASVAGDQVASYGQELIRLYQRRTLHTELDMISSELAAGGEPEEAVAKLELALAGQEDIRPEPRTMSLLAAQTAALQNTIDMTQGLNPAIPSGLSTLDDVLTMRRKRYTILAGATSMGKTAAAIWLAYSAAKAGYGVGFVSLEMGEEDLASRFNSIESQIPYKAFDRAMSESLLKKAAKAAQDMEALPVEIFSERVRDIPAILAEAKRLKAHWVPNEKFHGLGLLVIDYIQLVRGRGESQFAILSKIANDLKQVAKQLDVHIVALAQIDRKIIERDDKRPRLSDLRGSGDLENAPDNVLFCYRPEYYFDRQTPPKDVEKRADWEAERSAAKGKMELIIAKARMGELGSVQVGCDMATNRMWDLETTQDMGF